MRVLIFKVHRALSVSTEPVLQKGDTGIVVMKRLAVAGKNVRTAPYSSHRSTTSLQGFKLDASKNPWEGELNVDSAVADIG